MKDIQLEGVKMTDEMRAYRHVKNRLDLPDDRVLNLDTLWDMLGDIDEPTCVTLNDADVFKKNLGAFAYDMIDVFEDAVKVNDDLVFEMF